MPDKFLIDIEDKLKAMGELRIAVTLRQLDAAELLGVDQTTYSRWETGQKLPEAANLIRLCRLIDTWQIKLGLHLVEGDD